MQLAGYTNQLQGTWNRTLNKLLKAKTIKLHVALGGMGIVEVVYRYSISSSAIAFIILK